MAEEQIPPQVNEGNISSSIEELCPYTLWTLHDRPGSDEEALFPAMRYVWKLIQAKEGRTDA